MRNWFLRIGLLALIVTNNAYGENLSTLSLNSETSEPQALHTWYLYNLRRFFHAPWSYKPVSPSQWGGFGPQVDWDTLITIQDTEVASPALPDPTAVIIRITRK